MTAAYKEMVSTVSMTYMGDSVERGEVVGLVPGAPNNDKLINMRYFRDLSGLPTEKCDACSKEFDGASFRLAHQRAQHSQRNTIVLNSDGTGGTIPQGDQTDPRKREPLDMSEKEFENRVAV